MAEREHEHEHTRVMVVDNHQVVRAGIAFSLLTVDDIEVVGEAADGEEALRVYEEVHPDVVIMDLKMPKMDGFSAIRELRLRHPQAQILALSSYSHDDWVPRALQAGAVGYLLKTVELDGLIEAIRATHRGQPTFSREATQALVRVVTSGPSSEQTALIESLTARESDVLALLAEGLSNRHIAERLVITVATVKYHVRHLLGKFGVTRRTELVALAIHQHLVP
jgi:NarL family two-component system response regulator LiaR